jgi:PAS domain S-box-containing protein
MRNYLGEKVLDNLREGFQLIDFNWRYIYVNETVAKQAKKTREELLGKTMMEQFPGIEKTEMFSILKNCMENRIHKEFENPFKYGDGSVTWFNLLIQPVPEGLFILSLDISKRKEVESMLVDANQTLEKKVISRTQELQLINKDLTDSINYAKRIQQAMLVSKEVINNSFEDSFILLKPKSIVSGDFYYFHKNKENTYIAAADCTGHGVPGALMSMLCYEKLNEAVINYREPALALHQVNKKIKQTLSKSNNDYQATDGMDISLCKLNRNYELSFSGANRPLWIIRNENSQIEEVKGDRISIGGITPAEQKYEQQTIQLSKGDCFYLFSDGYTDLFGGPKEKKLMAKQFKQILLNIHHLSMREQKLYLSNFINEWRGELEQIDDILVIGIKV